jgi:hypothetical protein
VVLALALISVPPARADLAILSPVRDNTLFEDANRDTSNGSGPGDGRDEAGNAVATGVYLARLKIGNDAYTSRILRLR